MGGGIVKDRDLHFVGSLDILVCEMFWLQQSFLIIIVKVLFMLIDFPS